MRRKKPVIRMRRRKPVTRSQIEKALHVLDRYVLEQGRVVSRYNIALTVHAESLRALYYFKPLE